MSAIASEPPRNAPCPCGSGKRYKDCHGALKPPLAADGVAPLLAQARSALAQGDTGQAEAAWRQALESDPDQAEALFHLGNLERERGQHDLAVGHYRRALSRAPGHAGVLNNLGLTYEAQGQPDAAEACYREVLAATPNHPDALGQPRQYPVRTRRLRRRRRKLHPRVRHTPRCAGMDLGQARHRAGPRP